MKKRDFASVQVLSSASYLIAFCVAAFCAAPAPPHDEMVQSSGSQNLPNGTPGATNRQTAATGRMEFEAASVKIGTTIPMRGIEMLTPYDGNSPRGGLFSANAPLFAYLIFAYKVLDVSQYKTLHDQLPEWALTEPFEIEARADGNPSKDEMRLMMQTLLEDRFKLQHHDEVRQLPIYALFLDKPDHTGPQLQKHPSTVPCLDGPNEILLNGAKAPIPADAHSNTSAPALCGFETSRVNGDLRWTMNNATMDQIASVIGRALGGSGQRPVVNRTGLSGRFDMNLEFVPGTGVDQEDEWGPTLVGAIKKQLGLKLLQETGPMAKFVIDHVELPSGN